MVYLHSMNNFFLKLFHFYQDIRSPVFFSQNWRKSCNVPDFVLKQFSILCHVPLDLAGHLKEIYIHLTFTWSSFSFSRCSKVMPPRMQYPTTRESSPTCKKMKVKKRRTAIKHFEKVVVSECSVSVPVPVPSDLASKHFSNKLRFCYEMSGQ